MIRTTLIADILVGENQQAVCDLMRPMPRTAGDIRRAKGMSEPEVFAGDQVQVQVLVDALRKQPFGLRETDKDYRALMTLLALSPHDCALSYLYDLIQYHIRNRHTAELLVWCELLHCLGERKHLNTTYNQVAGYFYRARRDCRTGSERSITELELQAAERYMPEILPRTFYDTVMRNSQDVWNPRELAGRCGYSYHTFRKLFGRQFGCSVLQWMQGQRTELIRHLLAETDLDFEGIAEHCGFSSRSYLWDFCRRYFNDTPKGLRQQCKADKKEVIVSVISPE